MDEVLGDRPVTSAAAALQGAMPGLTIGGGSGPGAGLNLSIFVEHCQSMEDLLWY